MANTCVHIDRYGTMRASYRKIHMFDVEVEGRAYRESEIEEAGEEPVVSDTAEGVRLGLSICYDVRFPELYRIIALRGALVLPLPAAFTLATTRDHWEVLLRARAIENQAFVVAANQVGEHPGGMRSGGRSMIVDPWGVVLAQAQDAEGYVVAELDLDRQARIRREPAGAREPSRTPTAGRRRSCLASREQHRPRAPRRRWRRERARSEGGAGPARGDSAGGGEGVRPSWLSCLPRLGHRGGGRRGLRTRLPLLRLQGRGPRHALPRALGRDARGDPRRRRRGDARREKLAAIASFIIDSYRHDPELMKVIIVEVTRAANSFGEHPPRAHPRGLRPDREIVTKAQARWRVQAEIDAGFAAMAFYGVIEQVLTGWIFGLLPQDEEYFERAKWLVVETVCGGLGSRVGRWAALACR